MATQTVKNNSGFERARRLILLRQTLGLSQRELAQKFGVAHGAIGLWESGKRKISGPALKLLELYEESLEEGQTKFIVKKEEPTVEARPILTSHRGLKFSLDLVRGLPQILGSSLKQVIQNSSENNSLQHHIRLALMQQVVKSLGELKGMAMKIGQLMSYLDCNTLDAIQEGFEVLQTQSPAMPSHEVLEVFLKEFSKTPLQLFSEWNPKPFAAASIGQVHRAKLSSKEAVAVKVQYPQILKAFQGDLKTLKPFFRFSSLIFGWIHPDVFFEELRVRFLEECDYTKEAKNLAYFKKQFEHHPEVVIPSVFADYSTEKILTMELLGGRSFQAFLADASSKEKNWAGRVLFEFAYASIFIHQRFNGDPQPGNYLFQKNKIAFLDFGSVKQYSSVFLKTWRNLASALLFGNDADLDAAMLQTGWIRDPERFDFEYNRTMMRVMNEPWLSKRPFEFTRDYIQKTWRSCVAQNPNRFLMRVSQEYLFFERLQWGVYSMLAKLSAVGSWRKIIEPLVTQPISTA